MRLSSVHQPSPLDPRQPDAAPPDWEASFEVRERLAAANRSSPEGAADVRGPLWRLALLEGTGMAWKDVLARMEAMKAAGAPIAAHEPFLEQARRAAAEAAETK